MTENKPAEGLKFILKLDAAQNDFSKLLELANQSILASNTKRPFSERYGRDLPNNPQGIGIGAAIGKIHALTNKNLSTNDKLNMIMDRYIKSHSPLKPENALKKFTTELQKLYPEAYSGKTAHKSADIQRIAALKQRDR